MQKTCNQSINQSINRDRLVCLPFLFSLFISPIGKYESLLPSRQHSTDTAVGGERTTGHSHPYSQTLPPVQPDTAAPTARHGRPYNQTRPPIHGIMIWNTFRCHYIIIFCNMQMRFKQKLKKGLFFAFFPFCIQLAKLLGYPCHLEGYQSQDKC